MAKAKATPKANKPRIGQQTKSSAKGAHGGDVKFGMITFGDGFKVHKGMGINKAKSAAKLPQPKKSISEGMSRPAVVFGRGFGMNPFLALESKKWGQQASKKAGKPLSKSGTKGLKKIDNLKTPPTVRKNRLQCGAKKKGK